MDMFMITLLAFVISSASDRFPISYPLVGCYAIVLNWSCPLSAVVAPWGDNSLLHHPTFVYRCIVVNRRLDNHLFLTILERECFLCNLAHLCNVQITTAITIIFTKHFLAFHSLQVNHCHGRYKMFLTTDWLLMEVINIRHTSRDL